MSNTLSKISENKYDPFSWQGQLKEILLASKPGCRDIYWIYTQRKTTEIYDFIQYMGENHKAITAPAIGATMKLIMGEFITVHGTEPKIVLIDAISNMKLKTVSHASIDCIEEIKSGYFHLSHRNIRTIFIENPHVVVFALLKPPPDSNMKDIFQIIYLE